MGRKMGISLRSQSEVTILDIEGSLLLTRDNKVREHVAECLAGGRKLLLLNLAGVREIDSSGVGQLVQVLASTKKAGGQLKLLQPSEFVRKILSITGLMAVFECYDEEAAALASY